jgi:hypothetical protein
MAVDKTIIQYLKDNFTTQKHINDYIDELRATYQNGLTDKLRRAYDYYGLFIGDTSYARDYKGFRDNSVWKNKVMPVALEIIKPKASDPAWVSLREKAIGTTINFYTPGSTVVNVTPAVVLSYLRANFDKTVKKNIPINDPSLEKAWTKYYEDDKVGVKTGRDVTAFGTGKTLFGNWGSLGDFVEAVIARLQSFDIATGTIRGTTTTTPPGSPSAPTPTPEVDVQYGSRFEILEDFLRKSSGNTNAHGTYIAGLYDQALRKNNLRSLVSQST